MAPRSSTLAWKILWTAEPGGLQSMGSLRVRHTERLHFHFSLSHIGEGNGNPLQCSCLENPGDGGAWLAAVHGVTQSRTRLKWLSSSNSAHKLNKQSDNIQPWCTPFHIWNQYIVPCPCCFLTCIQISQKAGQVVSYSHLFKNFSQFVVIHTVKGFGIVNKAEIDVFLEFSCFLDDPTDVGNLISGSSAFSKSSWNIWKFRVHVLLKPGLENVENLENF